MGRQAITTKYIGPTNSRGSRVKAKAAAGSIIIPWDDGLDVNDNHKRAAMALANKFGWTGKLAEGGLPSGDGNVYVMVNGDTFPIEKVSVKLRRIVRRMGR